MKIIGYEQKKEVIKNFVEYIESALWNNSNKEKIINEIKAHLNKLCQNEGLNFDVEIYSGVGSYFSIIITGEDFKEEYFSSVDDGKLSVNKKEEYTEY